jgi:Kelch motif
MRQVREVLRLKFVGGVPTREIARRIGVAASTVTDTVLLAGLPLARPKLTTRHPRMSLGAATGTDKRIYAIGGEFFSAVNIVEAYDPSTNTWVAVTPMITPRRALAAAVGHDGRIYALGGIDNISGPLSSVEAFSL